MVGWGVRNLADLDAGLAEAARVLRPGARLVILEMTLPPDPRLRAVYQVYFRRVLPRDRPADLETYDRLYLATRVHPGVPAAGRARAAPHAAAVSPMCVGACSSAACARCMSGPGADDLLGPLQPPRLPHRHRPLGELVRVTHPVRARLEVAEIADRCMKSPGGGPALLFEHVLLEDGRRSPHPVAINLFGSHAADVPGARRGRSRRIGGRISELLNLKVPEGLFGKLAMLPKLAEIGQVPAQGEERPGALPGGGAARRRGQPRPDPVPHHLARRRRALHHPADGDHHRSRARHPQRRDVPGPGARAGTRSPCTGSGTRSARRTGGTWRSGASACPSSSPSAAIPPASTPAPPRCRRRSTSSSSPAFSGASRSSWCARSPATSRFPPRRRSCSRATSTRPSRWCWRDPSATTPASTPSPTTIPWSTSPRSPPGAIRSIRRRWWAGRRWRTSIWGTPPSGSSSRCSSSPCPRSWTTTCRPPGIFHNLVFVSIDKQYPGQAYKVMNALWGQGLMSLAKVLVIVDKQVNVRDPDEAWWIALNNIDPERDVRFTMGPMDVLDHASRGLHLRQQDGNRRHPEVEGRGLHRRVAGPDHHGRGDQAAGGRDVGPAGHPAV